MNRRWVLSVIVLISLGISIIGTCHTFKHARQNAQLKASQAAAAAHATLQTTLQQQIDAAMAVQAFESTLPPEHAFQRFANTYIDAINAIDAHSDIDALGYIDVRNDRRYFVPATAGTPASAEMITHLLTATTVAVDPMTRVAVVSIPIRRVGVIGVAQSVFDLNKVMADIQEQIGADLALHIASASGETLWTMEEEEEEEEEEERELLPPIAEETLKAGETAWTLKVGWLRPPPAPSVLLLLTSWLIFLLVLSGAFVIDRQAQRQARQLQEQVEHRTADLAASETRYRILTESLPLGLFIYTEQHIQFINQAMGQMLHLRTTKNPAQICLTDFMPAADYQKLIATLTRGDPVQLEPWHTKITRADGSTFLGEITAIPLRFRGEPAVTGMLRDITEQANTRSRLQNLNQILRAILHINHALIHTEQTLAPLYQQICQIIVDERGYDAAWIGNVKSEPAPHLNSVYAAPEKHRTRIAAWLTQTDPYPDKNLVAEQALQQGENVIATDPAALLGRSLTTAAFPIWVHDEIFAIFNASTSSPQAFAYEEEIGLLNELVGDLGLAIERIQNESRRRKMEEALRTSEERFRRLAEYAAVGVVLIQDERFRYVNPAFAKMFGYQSPNEMREQLSVGNCVAPDERERVLDNLKNALSGNLRALHFKFKGQRKEGAHFKAEVHGARAIHARRPALIATVVDITEQERSQSQLQSLLQAGLALSQAHTFNKVVRIAVQQALNIVPGDAANIFILQGEEIWLMEGSGYERLSFEPEAMARAGSDILKLPTYEKMLATQQPLIINDTTASKLWKEMWGSPRIRAYLGVPLIVRGKAIGVLNVDSTQSHRFESADGQRLQLFADYVAATIENLRLITSLEAERNRLEIVNELSQTLAATLSLSIQEVGARTLEKIARPLHSEKNVIFLWDDEAHRLRTLCSRGIPQKGLKKLDEQLAKPDLSLTEWVAQSRASALAPDVRENPYWYYVPEADEWVKSALIVPLEAHGELVGVLSLLSKQLAAFDEKDLQLVEALSVPIALALQNAQFYADAAHQAEVMAEALAQQEELDQMKDELIQNISHELRTPLSLVFGYAMILQQGELGELPAMQAHAVAIIARRSQMLRELVENMTLLWKIDSTAAKGEAPEKVKIDLGDLAAIAVEEFQTAAREHQITVALEREADGARGARDALDAFNEEPLIIAGVPLQIQRMLDNLLGNALKFTPDGGRITVKLAREDDQRVRLAVCDTGIGIPPEKQEQIFERFYQVDGSSKRQYGGVGLGLALVRSIVQTHEGRLRVQSPATDDPEHPGTCMIVSLPLRREAEA
ncbi:MAG: GAF domain-containing protein [Anaerolineales bacterium]